MFNSPKVNGQELSQNDNLTQGLLFHTLQSFSAVHFSDATTTNPTGNGHHNTSMELECILSDVGADGKWSNHACRFKYTEKTGINKKEIKILSGKIDLRFFFLIFTFRFLMLTTIT